MKRLLIIISAALFVFNNLSAQTVTTDKPGETKSVAKDTVSKWKYPSPRMAGLLSAAVPGLGQAYNKKYWKMPLVYAGLGTCIYFTLTNHEYYQFYKKAYILVADTIPDNEITSDLYSADQLYLLQDKYHRQRDLFIIIGAVVYAANIVDAVVDAHLYEFDVSDKLSLNVRPYVQPGLLHRQTFQSGLTLSLKFK